MTKIEVVAQCLAQAAEQAGAAGRNIDPDAGAGWKAERRKLLAEAERLRQRAEAVRRGAGATDDDLDHVPYDAHSGG